MAVAVSLSVTPTAPNHGDTVTATYTVAGNDPIAPQTASLEGDVTVGAETIHASTVLTLPGEPAQEEAYTAPVCQGLTFAATGDPKVFTSLVP